MSATAAEVIEFSWSKGSIGALTAELTNERPSWGEYFLNIAVAVSTRSDCERDKVGAVVVGSDRRIRAAGYNGAPAGMEGCSTCPRRTSEVAPGSCYSNCVAIHAEMNALLYCDRSDLPGSTLYVTRCPCYGCMKAIYASGIKGVYYKEGDQIKWLNPKVASGLT